MPGDRKHHTDKFRRCVDDVKAKGHSDDSAHAICTTSLQDAGEPIFETASQRALHLRGAVGAVVTEIIDGREHLVVPCVALQEGVLHAINARTPEFVSASVLTKSYADWDKHPLVVGHPLRNGKQVSAQDTKILAEHGFGHIRAPKMNGTRLGLEAIVDPERLEILNQKDLLADLRAGKPIEVSVGAFVTTNDKESTFNGKHYKGEWLEIIPDHLAFLPGGRGACSLEMGCGAHRAATHFVTAEAFEEIIQIDVLTFTTLEGASLDDRIAAVNRAADRRWNINGPSVAPSSYTYVQQVYDDHVILRNNEKTFSVPYMMTDTGAMNGQEVVFGEATEVKQVWVTAAKYEDCPICKGSGNVGGNPCEACDSAGEIKVAAGARHSGGDVALIQAVHDNAIALGATCDRSNYKMMAGRKEEQIEERTAGHNPTPDTTTVGVDKIYQIEVKPVAAAAADIGREQPQLRAACRCEEKEMALNPVKKAELIAALVTDQHSGFKDGDEKLLESFPDERLEELRAASAERRTAADAHEKLVNDQRNLSARLKVSEEKLKTTEDALKTAQQKPTKEQWLEAAPPEVKSLLESEEKRTTEHRNELIGTLKTAQSEFTEDDLKGMELSMLERLAKAVKVETVDFSGRGIPATPRAAGAAADIDDYTPPNPYDKDIKTLQAASKAVN